MTNHDEQKTSESWHPKVIGWDFWETFYKSHPIEPPILVARGLGLPVDTDQDLAMRFIAFCNACPAQNQEELLQAAAETFHTTVTPAARNALRDAIDVERKDCSIKHDVEPTLEAIQKAGIPQGLISNIWGMNRAHVLGCVPCGELPSLLPPLRINKYLSQFVLSCDEDVACVKPNPKPFQVFVERFRKELGDENLKPEDILYVGDSVENDIKGALAVGMRAALIDRQRRVPREVVEELQREGVIYLTSLVELLPILGIAPTSVRD
jgi:FMN phosphatase YigB (HAD superfamily)